MSTFQTSPPLPESLPSPPSPPPPQSLPQSQSSPLPPPTIPGLPSNPTQALSAGNRVSTRMSTYSTAPTLTPSIAPSQISHASTMEDPKVHDIKSWNAGFERLEDQRLVQQRYKLTNEKNENLSKLALGAKLDRALSRRMSSQDAVFRSKGLSEKTLEAQV